MSLFPTAPSDRRVRVLAWASLVLNVLIVGTGGAVRLTGSGLGCPTWPLCTEDSLVNTPEMGIHGVIEFGNRLIGVALVIIGLLTFLSVVRMWRRRRDLFALALALGFAVPVQAVIGGITVLSGLNPYVVGLHFLVSVAMVALATVYVHRVYRGGAPRKLAVPGWFAGIVHALSALVFLTVVAGILTTGSGPHAGDSGAARNGLDPAVLQHVHSWPAYALGALTVVALLIAVRERYPGVQFWLGLLLVTEVAQIAVGLIQARAGLPPLLVGIHMVLATVLAGVMAATVLSLRRPAPPSLP